MVKNESQLQKDAASGKASDDAKKRRAKALAEAYARIQAEIDSALEGLPEGARAILQGDSDVELTGISLSRRDDGKWRVTLSDMSQGDKRVCFSTLETPAALWARLPEIVLKADWQESKF